jgi:hypothetical protein
VAALYSLAMHHISLKKSPIAQTNLETLKGLVMNKLKQLKVQLKNRLTINITRLSNGQKTVGCFHSVQHFSQQFFAA